MKEYLASYFARCGSGATLEYLEEGSYILEECDDCGLIYQKEIPGAFLINKLYEEWIDPKLAYNSAMKERDSKYYLYCAAEMTAIIQYLGKVPSEVKFFDFGMGWGSWCLIAKGFGCDPYGTELSETRNDHASAQGIKVLNWEEITNHQFDFINAEQVFEHLADPLATLIYLRRALKPDGVIRISVPSCPDIKRRLKVWDWEARRNDANSLIAVAPLQHINLYKFESLEKMAEKAGLEEVEISNDLLQPRDLKGKARSILRPYINSLFPGRHEMRRRGSTKLCFRPIREQLDKGYNELAT